MFGDVLDGDPLAEVGVVTGCEIEDERAVLETLALIERQDIAGQRRPGREAARPGDLVTAVEIEGNRNLRRGIVVVSIKIERDLADVTAVGTEDDARRRGDPRTVR